MNVITLDNRRFFGDCRELACDIALSGFRPDIIVGIASGGDFVARNLKHSLAFNLPVFSVSLHRPTTKAKRVFLSRMLAHLPRPLCNLLRITESRIYSLIDRIRKPKPHSIELPADLRSHLQRISGYSPCILVADDAVDSGLTLACVMQSLRDALPGADVRAAVFTVTRPNPLLRPDYVLYPSPVLIRFPWAPDA